MRPGRVETYVHSDSYAKNMLPADFFLEDCVYYKGSLIRRIVINESRYHLCFKTGAWVDKNTAMPVKRVN